MGWTASTVAPGLARGTPAAQNMPGSVVQTLVVVGVVSSNCMIGLRRPSGVSCHWNGSSVMTGSGEALIDDGQDRLQRRAGVLVRHVLLARDNQQAGAAILHKAAQRQQLASVK